MQPNRPAFVRSSWLLLALLGWPAASVCQDDAARLPPDRLGHKTATPLGGAGVPLEVPPVPAAAFALAPHSPPPVPPGRGGNPPPATPPARELAPGAAPAGFGAFTYFTNTVVQPAGATRSTTASVSPGGVTVRDTALQVGNWYAALSRDTGQTWRALNPATFFNRQLDAGFCCNQRLEYIASHDLTVWVQQYGYSATTQRGSFLLAVANGRDELRSGNPADWTAYVFDPTDFGFPARTWLDQPELGFTNDWLYMAANVYDDASPAALVGAVRWRLSLSDLQQNLATVPFSYLTDAAMGGHSYRFASRAGDGSTMYWAALLSTTTMRVFRHPAIGVTTAVDRTTAPWLGTFTNACVGPDNRGWLGTATHHPVGQIRGGCGTASELVFAWTADGNGTSRPYPYTRVTRLRVSDRTLLAEHDIYSLSDGWAFAALDSNSLGHVGGVIAIGGSSRYVRTSAFLIDQYELGWSGVTAYRMGDPTNNPPGGRFGDWFEVRRSWHDPRTFVGSGHFLNGGDQSADVEPHHVWFGRNDYEPGWVDLEVSSTPVPAAITVDVSDRFGAKDGTAPFRRSFAPHQGYALTAPAQLTSGGMTLSFRRWIHDGVPGPLYQRTLSVDDLGTSNDTAQAEYRARRTIAFAASGPFTTPVGLTLSPPDLNGQTGGQTPFTRDYAQDEPVTVSLLVTNVGGHPFSHWRIAGVAWPEGQRTVTFTVPAANANAVAVFREHVAGGFTPFGAACAGSNGLDAHAAAGTPETGNTITWRLAGGPVTSAALVALGFSDSSWAGVPLPLALPGAPGCWLNVAFDVAYPATTDALGQAAVDANLPNDATLIGGRVFTQFLAVDPGANALGLSASNGLELRLGGLR